MRIGRSVLIKSSLVLVLCAGTIIPVIANSDDSKHNGKAVTTNSVQSKDQGSQSVRESNILAPSMLDGSKAIKINEQIEMRLTHLQMMPDTENQIVSFTLTITNDSPNDLNFIDYWVQLKTVKGTEYPIDYLTTDKDQDIIPAKSSKDFQFYAEVAPDLTYSDLIFELIAWDFSEPNYRRTIGSIKAPAGYTPLVEHGKTGVIRHANSRYHFRIDEMYAFDTGNTKRLELQLILENMSSRSTPLPNVTYSLLTEDGYIYLLQPVHAAEGSLAPRIETTITLSGQLPEDIDLTTTRFLVFTTGESVDLPLALYGLPAITEAPAPPEISLGGNYTIELDRTNIHMSVNDYTLKEQKEEKNEDEKDKEKEEKEDDKPVFYDAEITVLFENSGRYSGNVPSYDYSIEFLESGDVFPLTIVEDSSAFPLHPRMKHELKLAVTLPEELIDQSVRLIIRSNEDDENGRITYDQIASFIVPDATIIIDEEDKEPEEEPEKEMAKYNVREIYKYQTLQGEYFIHFEKMERYPWESEDILAAHFVIANPTKQTLQIPDLSGVFKLDGILLKDYETQIVHSNRAIGIAPGKQIELIMYIKVPYSYQYSSAGLIVSGNDEPPKAEDEKDQLEKIEDVEFIYNRDLATIPQVAADEKVVFDFISTKTELQLKDLVLSKDDDSQSIYIHAEMTNLENRESRLPELKAYLKAGNSQYIPLELSYEGALSPGGKALIVISSTLANRYNVNDMQLIIGELIPGQEAYLNTVAIELPESKQSETKRSLQNLSIYPYTLSFNSVQADFSFTDSIRFEYELSIAEHNYEIMPEGQRIIIEFVDDDAKFERAYQLGTDLKLGEHVLNFNIGIPSEELIDLMNGFDRYTINIYTEYGSNRQLIASTNYTYF